MDNKMRKDINEFLNDKTVINKIKACITETNKTGNEMAFHYAFNDKNNIITSRIIEGDSGGVDIETNIDWMKYFQFKKHGDFHTHPSTRKIILPSINDIRQALFNQTYFTCIGMFVNDIITIKCFPTYIINKAIIDIKEYLKDIDDLSYIKDDTERLVLEFHNAANELSQSMRYAPESWENSIIIKEYK